MLAAMKKQKKYASESFEQIVQSKVIDEIINYNVVKNN